MKQVRRLQSAKAWLLMQKKNNIIRAYRKHYAVDWLCAIRELEMLGIALDPEYVKAIKHRVERKFQTRKRKKIEKQKNIIEDYRGEHGLDYDEYFSYIAGFTEGGAAYGVPWESSYSY